MSSKKTAVTIGLIASAILGAGYAFHDTPAVASVLGYQAPDNGARLRHATFTAGEIGTVDAVFRPPMDMRPPLQPVNRPLMTRQIPASATPSPSIDGDTDNAGRTCTPQLDAVLGGEGLILLALDAPCDPGARVDIRHGALAFSGRTDAYGRYSTAVPALTILATFQAAVGDATAEITIAAPDAGTMRRVGVQWQGDAGLTLHALEFGARPGEAGHVWNQSPGSTWTKGGTLLRLGDPELAMAEVYSFPVSDAMPNGVVDVFVEAAATDQTCGTTLAGQAIQTQTDGVPVITDLSLEMPACGADEGTQVLKKTIGTIKIAAN